ncbi:MAG: hypothetical protein WC076_11515 [Terrimicrobiaceae bacterium]
MKETKLTALARRILELADSNRELRRGLARHEEVNRSLEIEGKRSDLLLEESRHLQNRLQEMTRNPCMDEPLRLFYPSKSSLT